MNNVQKTSEMVAVVRCKDCKYGEPETNASGYDMTMCTNTNNPLGFDGWLMPPDWYCADGKRKGE